MAFVTRTGAEAAALDFEETVALSALAVTDTAAHASAAIDCRGFRNKTLFVTNSLNQAGNLSILASRDGATWTSLGGAIALGAASGNTCYGSASGSATRAELGDAWPYLQVSYTATVAPASGAISVWLEKTAG